MVLKSKITFFSKVLLHFLCFKPVRREACRNMLAFFGNNFISAENGCTKLSSPLGLLLLVNNMGKPLTPTYGSKTEIVFNGLKL